MVRLIRSLSGMFLNCPRQPSCGAERAPSGGCAAKHSRQQTSDRCLQTQTRCLCLCTVVLRYCTPSFLCRGSYCKSSLLFSMGPKTPQSQEKRKRNVLTLSKKTELVKRMEKGESRSKLMAEYGVGSSTLYDLKKQR